MFYSQFILAKKGPLGTIWIAAHLERKLRKNQVSDTDIGVSVDSILFPDVPIALRLSSHLLLGVVRIYSRKVNYLFDDCSETLLKIKQAFRSTAVDLPPEESTAPYHSITLPETFDLDDFELPDGDIFQGNYVDHHVSAREQITLQDTMEGVVYSTTQFGLDEQFGDGDTSGLDLDEELFLNKVTAPGHAAVMLGSNAEPRASVRPMTPVEQDKNNEGINGNSELVATGRLNELEGLGGSTDSIEYAQAPCTPGLVEEPNLSKIQEASACDDHLELGEEPNLSNIQEALASDDHLESEDQNLIRFAAKENWEMNQLKSWGDSSSTAGDCHSAEPVKAIPLISKMPDVNFTAFDGANRVEDLQNEVFSNNVNDTQAIDRVHGNSIQTQGLRLDETISCPNLSQELLVLEDAFGNSSSGIENTAEKSSLSSTCQPVSDCILEINQASVRLQLPNNVENAGNMEKSWSSSNPVISNSEPHGRQDLEIPETQACQDPKDTKMILNPCVHEKIAAADMHVLQQCMHLNQPSMSNPVFDMSVAPHLLPGVTELCSTETSGRKEAAHALGASIELHGQGFHADFMKPVLVENHTTEPASFGDIQVDCSKLNDQVHNVISEDAEFENLDGPEGSELPAPEKLLSVLEGLPDVQDNLLVVSTPDKALLVTGDGGDAGINIISGKKRCFTGSALTMQSLNSVESLVVAQSKRTKESVPDDNDLLSSILVGRRSSVLKLKPTPPPPPEITCMKRPRSAPRVFALKRKVLMDDTMVLHGDVIRQQLTSTEDIRRIRKKAPCSHPEIWMIRKELLEDEIFSEPIFTGLSTELALFHCQTCDLSEIRVSQDDAHDAFQEAAADLYLVSKKNESNPSKAANDVEFSMEPNLNKKSGTIGVSESMGVRNDGEAEPPGNPHSEVHVLQSHGYDNQVTAGSMLMSTSLDKERCSDGSLQMDGPGVTPDYKLDPQTVEMDASIVYVRNGRGVDAMKVAEENDDSAAVGGTESRTGDECLLEKTEVGASVEIGAGMQIPCSAHTGNEDLLLSFSPETDRSDNQVVVTIDLAMEEISKNKQGVVNEDEVLAAELDYDGKNSCEEPKVASLYSVELNVDVKNASLNDGEYPGLQEADLQCTIDAEIAACGHTATEDYVDFDYTIDGHDTGFLNADDDCDVAEEDDYILSAEQTSFFENSGWSSRTRAVAKYLQVLFDKEAEHGRKVLPMDNLLVGKTRKEASRMFFEALVLKTRDYINVEQGIPFDNINIRPQLKLMKSDF